MASLYSAASKGKRKATDEVEQNGSATTTTIRNKQRVLILPSRGVTMRMRHLVNDLESLLPHSKKDSKLDSKSNLHILNELAELNNCNNTLYFEARKHEDLYLWASKTPNGPSVKFHVQNIHTMDELKMQGNCLKGSRPLLSFDASFDQRPHLGLIKELFTQMFGVPRMARKSKPFIDHVISFSVLDNKVWFRHYQIIEKGSAAAEKASSANGSNKKGSSTEDQKPTLVEIGPRMVLTPIRIFEGSFGGATVYENPEYISPNMTRHLTRRKQGEEYKDRTNAQFKSEAKRQKLVRDAKPDELSRQNVFG
ncbi:hypothetical protein L7F22_050203 [Adiantum nelumboides]|nr:hypothetical protein [Adiantum nelumboides]